MGSGDWFKNMISSKKAKDGRLKQIKGSSEHKKSMGLKSKTHYPKESSHASNGNSNLLQMPVEDVAAIRIQTAFRAYKARKTFRHMKGMVRLKSLTQGPAVKKQASSTLGHLHAWSRIQGQITARRLSMVREGRLKQKKLENQLRLEAKLHDLEVEWSSGSETMEEILGRIYHREEAAGKRERAMAYAFSHQWRPNASLYLGPNTPELGTANWGWSWMDRWIAARPWESRVQTSPKKTPRRQANKVGKNTVSPNGKSTTKPRKLSYAAAEKTVPQEGGTKADEANIKKEEAIPQTDE